MRKPVFRAAVTASIIVLFALVILKMYPPSGAGDTRVFLTGASLCGPNLYKADLQKTFSGDKLLPYFRAPFYACALRPLLYFDFHQAWLVVNLVAAAALIVAIPSAAGTPWLSAIFIPLFVPLYGNIDTGQDGAIVLLVLAGVLLLERRGWDVAAGALLALTLQKPSLYLLFPLILAVQRKFRMLAAYCVAGLILAAVSLGTVGFAAIADYMDLVRRDNYSIVNMPVARGLAAYLGSPLLLAVLVCGTLGAAVQIARRLDFRVAFSFAVAAGFFVSPQSFRHDWAILLIPAFYFSWHGNALVRCASFALLTPPLYMVFIAFGSETPGWWAVRSSMLALYITATTVGLLWRPTKRVAGPPSSP